MSKFLMLSFLFIFSFDIKAEMDCPACVAVTPVIAGVGLLIAGMVLQYNSKTCELETCPSDSQMVCYLNPSQSFRYAQFVDIKAPKTCSDEIKCSGAVRCKKPRFEQIVPFRQTGWDYEAPDRRERVEGTSPEQQKIGTYLAIAAGCTVPLAFLTYAFLTYFAESSIGRHLPPAGIGPFRVPEPGDADFPTNVQVTQVRMQPRAGAHNPY